MKNLSISAAVLFLVFTVGLLACKTEGIDNEQENTDNDAKSFYNTSAEVKTEFINGEKVYYQEIDGYKITDGDIIIGKISDDNLNNSTQIDGTRLIDKYPKLFWPNNRIPYCIDTNSKSPIKKMLPHIQNAIARIEANTPIRFVWHDLYDKKLKEDHIIFVSGKNGDPCFSWMGREGGEQTISLGYNKTLCIDHELGHAIGLYHEHQRFSRDNDVVFYPENCVPAYRYAFSKVNDKSYDVGEFDFKSMMLYGSMYFSIDGKKPTMITRHGNKFDRYSSRPSSGDYEAINAMYKKK